MSGHDAFERIMASLYDAIRELFLNLGKVHSLICWLHSRRPEVAPENRGSCLRCIPPTEEGYAMTKRRRFSGELKAKVALEALRGDRTLQEIASKHQVHPNQVSTWKPQAMEGFGEMFSNGVERRRRDHESEVRELHAKIGELTVERNFFSRGSGRRAGRAPGDDEAP